MVSSLESYFVSKENYDGFIKTVEEKLSDESKLMFVLDDVKKKIEDGMSDLDIQENTQMNILTIVVPSSYFAPKNVFICDVHLIREKNGKVLVKY